MIFNYHVDEGGTTAVWRGIGMVGHRNDGLTWCDNGCVSTSDDRRAEKERENRMIFKLEEGNVDCVSFGRAGSQKGRPR